MALSVKWLQGIPEYRCALFYMNIPLLISIEVISNFFLILTSNTALSILEYLHVTVSAMVSVGEAPRSGITSL